MFSSLYGLVVTCLSVLLCVSVFVIFTCCVCSGSVVIFCLLETYLLEYYLLSYRFALLPGFLYVCLTLWCALLLTWQSVKSFWTHTYLLIHTFPQFIIIIKSSKLRKILEYIGIIALKKEPFYISVYYTLCRNVFLTFYHKQHLEVSSW